MRTCNYCGKANADASRACAGCGSALDEPRVSFGLSWAGFFAWAGLLVGFLGLVRTVLLTLPFFWLHHDIGNGAALWFGLLCLTGFWTLLLGLPCAIIGILKRRRVIGWLGVLFALFPVPLGFGLLHVAMALNGFHILA